METYQLTSAQDNATGEYRQVGYMPFEHEARRIMQFWLWVFITTGAAFVFSFLARNFGKLPEDFRIGISEIVIGIVGSLVTLVIHEWFHILVMWRFGARPEFGLTKNKVIATITARGYGFRRNTLIWILLMPLVALTSLALLGIWLTQGSYWVALFALVAIINAGAAIADLWIVAFLLRYPGNAWTVDDKDGMHILLPID